MDRTVTTQAELDAALKDSAVDWIEIRSPYGVWLDLVKSDSATVTAYGSATVTASGSATVTAYGSATVRASDSATVTASGSATVTASGSATVRAYGSATVTAYGSATVRASDSATVTAYDSTVTASDSATVTAYGSATVTASGSATVRAYGSATVTAGTHTAVHLHSAHVKSNGGVIIDHTKIDLTDPKAWCDYHGVKVTKAGIVTLYKAVNPDWQSGYGFDYSPGSKPEAPDWRDTDECGYGLHFGPTPSHAAYYHSDQGTTRYLRVGVNLAELRPISGGGAAKAKAKRVVKACVEVDIDGNEVAS